jgi:hypothetical protein
MPMPPTMIKLYLLTSCFPPLEKTELTIQMPAFFKSVFKTNLNILRQGKTVKRIILENRDCSPHVSYKETFRCIASSLRSSQSHSVVIFARYYNVNWRGLINEADSYILGRGIGKNQRPRGGIKSLQNLTEGNILLS